MTNFKRNPATMPSGALVFPPIPDPGPPTVAYARWGCYYNWHAVDSGKGLAPDGYKIPSRSDLTTLRDYIEDNYDAATGDKAYNNEFAAMFSDILQSSSWYGFYYDRWTGTNESLWNWLPAGELHRDGSFWRQNYRCSLWTSSVDGSGRPLSFYNGFGLDNTIPDFAITGESTDRYKRYGYSVRCLLQSGETPPANGKAQDIDGNSYDVIQIGTQHWMAQNLRTTTFKNGDSIPQGTSANDWDTKSNNGAAFAYYNFNANYV